MKLVDIKNSPRKDKRLVATVDALGKLHKIHFGLKGGSTFLEHGDENKKDNYIKRHIVNENHTNPLTAGFWARWILWNKPTLNESIADVKRKFDL
jgi:hypothetical protein